MSPTVGNFRETGFAVSSGHESGRTARTSSLCFVLGVAVFDGGPDAGVVGKVVACLAFPTRQLWRDVRQNGPFGAVRDVREAGRSVVGAEVTCVALFAEFVGRVGPSTAGQHVFQTKTVSPKKAGRAREAEAVVGVGVGGRVAGAVGNGSQTAQAVTRRSETLWTFGANAERIPLFAEHFRSGPVASPMGQTEPSAASGATELGVAGVVGDAEGETRLAGHAHRMEAVDALEALGVIAGQPDAVGRELGDGSVDGRLDGGAIFAGGLFGDFGDTLGDRKSQKNPKEEELAH